MTPYQNQNQNRQNLGADDDCPKEYICSENQECREGCGADDDCKTGKVCRGYVGGRGRASLFCPTYPGKCYYASGFGTVAGDKGTKCVYNTDCSKGRCKLGAQTCYLIGWPPYPFCCNDNETCQKK